LGLKAVPAKLAVVVTCGVSVALVAGGRLSRCALTLTATTAERKKFGLPKTAALGKATVKNVSGRSTVRVKATAGLRAACAASLRQGRFDVAMCGAAYPVHGLAEFLASTAAIERGELDRFPTYCALL